MPFETLIDATELATLLDTAQVVIVDCRFDLADTEKGRYAYEQGHIPGAVYAHLDRDLSGKIIPGVTSRHPLPSVTSAEALFSRWGIADGRQVVAYDAGNGAVASRLWWMLKWLGHDAVAVLEGGWPAWTDAGGQASTAAPDPEIASFRANLRPEMVVSTETVSDPLFRAHNVLLDARASERYLGEIEPIDPVAGHIPGALCVPFAENLDSSNHFLPSEALRERFQRILGSRSAEEVVCYCGSGVTAAHNVLAMSVAGLGLPRLYAGSWSEWITDSTRPVAAGRHNQSAP